MEKKLSVLNLTDELALKCGIGVSAAEGFLRSFFDVVAEGLAQDGIVKVKGWGTFKLADIKDRESVDVNTGERIVIKGYRKVSFLPDTALKEHINRPFSQFETTELSDEFQVVDEVVETEEPTEDEEHVIHPIANENENPAQDLEPISEPASEQESALEPEATLEPVTAPEPELVPEPEPTPELTPELEATPEPTTIPEPEPTPEPEAVPEAIIASEVEQTPAPALETTPESKPTTEQESTPEPEPTPEPEATPILPPDNTKESQSDTKPERKPRRSWRYWLPIFLLVLISVCLYIYIAFGDGFAKPKVTMKSGVKDNLKVEAIEFDDDPQSALVTHNPTKKEKKDVTSGDRKDGTTEVVPAAVENPAEAADDENEKTTDVQPVETVEPPVSVEKAAASSEGKTEVKPEAKEATKTEAKPDVKETTNVVAKSTSQPASKPGANLEKSLKDITMADTISHTMEGTQATHVVQEGETIIRLAQKYYGDKRFWPYIVKYNNMKNPDNVVVGKAINIPVLKAK